MTESRPPCDDVRCGMASRGSVGLTGVVWPFSWGKKLKLETARRGDIGGAMGGVGGDAESGGLDGTFRITAAGPPTGLRTTWSKPTPVPSTRPPPGEIASPKPSLGAGCRGATLLLRRLASARVNDMDFGSW